jgi:hypothetical protein
LTEWISKNLENPYPSRDDKSKLSLETGLNPIQVSNWFSNWRKRKWEKNNNTESNSNNNNTNNLQNQHENIEMEDENTFENSKMNPQHNEGPFIFKNNSSENFDIDSFGFSNNHQNDPQKEDDLLRELLFDN